VGIPSVFSGHAGPPHDGIAVDSDEPLGLSDPVTLHQVLEDGDHFFRWQTGVGKRSALAFGESGLAGVAGEQSDRLMLAVAVADREIAGVSLTVERAVGILAAEAREVVHG
jgi:hypothetical protein